MSDIRDRARKLYRKEWSEDNREDMWDGIAMVKFAVAFAESEAALARKQERVECCKSMCACCGADADDFEPAEMRNGNWKHKWKDGTGYAMCDAAKIHERNLAETGG